ncbi:MAG: 4Fe-4S binding protein [Eggerthellaceae bacterium]|nr:4Fe-4S binding protein [Eggerthellaceae bacterium]
MPQNASAKKTSSKNSLKTRSIRMWVIAAIFVVLAAGLIAGVVMGTLSGFGLETFSVLCPLGALGTMLAAKMMIPRAVISIIAMLLFFFILGRAFCAWMCPTTLLHRIQNFFRSPKKRAEIEAAKKKETKDIANFELSVKNSACGQKKGCANCTHCHEKRQVLDSRHYILGGALLSTAIFGFPVFCLICPIGLSFASVLVIWRLFSAGDVTWSVLLVPALLVVEIVFLKKWCTRFCPLSALMNLTGRFSRTFLPVINNEKCLETTKGVACSRCAEVCEYEINLRHPEFGEHTLADCSRCRDCADACPTKAITFPVLARARAKAKSSEVVYAEIPHPVMLDEENEAMPE